MTLLNTFKNQTQDLLRWQSDFVLEKGSGAALGLMRIAFGLLACAHLAIYLNEFNVWFSESGWLNSDCANLTLTSSVSLLSGVRDEHVILAFLLVTLMAAILMTVGLFSRAATIVTWAGLLSIHNRTWLIRYGGDALIQIMIFYLCWADTGSRYSVDSLARSRQPREVSLWPQKMIQFQIALVYLSTFLFKLLDPTWVQGHAVYYALHNLIDFQNFWLPEFFRNPPMTTILNYGTLVTELSLVFLPFCKRYRNRALLAGLALHIGIGYCLLIPLFEATSVAAYLAFFKGEEVSEFLRRVQGKLAVLTRAPL